MGMGFILYGNLSVLGRSDILNQQVISYIYKFD